VDLGFVSAYVLVRGGEAAVVDTGVGGSADQIGAVLDDAGPGWAGVRHVVLTHKHPDHVGSLGDVADRAAAAKLYAGAPDVSAIDAPRRLRTVADGDEVFGLQVVTSPGHTAGHVAVFDADSGVLVAGDALGNTDGLAGSNPQFTEDDAAAADSVRKLAALRPRVILVGHGPPVERSAAAQLERLARSLG
jgi:glyoxylase-like metal-dependent hydrolase (beta-lactamase superfamily II)